LRKYLDTSALLKRVVIEPDSAALRQYLGASQARGDLLASSSLAWVEVWRALRRLEVPDIDEVGELTMSGVAEFEMTETTMRLARRLGPQHLRSLDALHLACAVQLGVQTVVTYDDRMAEAAAIMGFEVAAPA